MPDANVSLIFIHNILMSTGVPSAECWIYVFSNFSFSIKFLRELRHVVSIHPLSYRLRIVHRLCVCVCVSVLGLYRLCAMHGVWWKMEILPCINCFTTIFSFFSHFISTFPPPFLFFLSVVRIIMQLYESSLFIFYIV